MKPCETAALIVAGGRGVRAGAGLPKQYLLLGGEPVLRRTIRAFAKHADVEAALAVIHPDDTRLYDAAVTGLPKLLPAALGGSSRQQSVLAGLEALLPAAPRMVLIHDAARPFVSADLISRICARARAGHAVVPGLPPTDSLKRVDAGTIVGTLARADAMAVQTPQAFPFDAILAAHRQARAAARDDFTDDAAVAEFAGMAVEVVQGDEANVKLTTPADMERAERMFAMETRTGQGFDVHAFGLGDSVWLCGVKVPFHLGLVGHSDADVALHALADAILGALAEGDIGEHFPPSDPEWKGASSDRFLADAVRRVRDRGGRILHLDVTLVCEAPKLAPHREAMRRAVAGVAQVDATRVSVKATTSERLGFTGRGEGIAAMALATIELPVAG